ncbi:MAG: tetratricopeptide repeat protein [Thermodesulfovibrionales bacterium]|nr:tetratricopeptide repeat protein [Thermodesulfovibrionales bacterium]
MIRKGLSVISDLKNLINFKLSPISGYGLLFFSIIILFISSCGLPRIIILTDPLSPEEHINLGLSYEEKAEYDAALREYETAARKLDIAYLYIGNLYFKMGDYEKAERAYRKAIKKTSDPRAMNNLAWLYYILNKDLDRAEELAQEAVKKDPGNQDFIDTLMRIRERRGGHAF